MTRLVVAAVAMLALGVPGRALGADARPTLPVKARPPAPTDDWSGLYVGGHFGYAAGTSSWTATGAGGPPLTGTLAFFNPFDAFKGTGSYDVGLQAGYNALLPSRLLLGVEADVSFPNSILGSQTITAASVGQASYSEAVQMSGTVRGRIGYAPGHWLVYATGGLAWTFDQFTRTQLAGGNLDPGTVESLLLRPRLGVAVGAGVELAVASNWSARFEYLFTDYGSRSVLFPASAQQFESDLALHSLRVGLNYRIGNTSQSKDSLLANGIPALETDNFALHGQATYLQQYAFPFRSPYQGHNSLTPNQGRETADVTFDVGARLWQGAELWVDADIDQGFGLNNSQGVAGYLTGTAFKIGSSVPYARIPRSFIRQTIDLGGAVQKIDADANQFAGSQTADRLVITVGKFGVSDVFDTNKYAQNPRKDFFNWALSDAGSFDYVADAWGYSYGAAVEWYKGDWTVRGGIMDAPNTPNNTDLDPSFNQFQWLGEIEHRHELWGQPGKIAVTGFLTRARMGHFTDATQLAQITGGPADIAAVRRYTSRGGLAANLEQQIADDLGLFARAGIADGSVESDAYTDIDRTVAAGLSLTGKRWGRSDDTVGVAGIVNGISSARQAFLNAGGLGILVGDGMLPNPGLEQIIETYYSLPLASWRVTFDYQFVVNPAYNRDRGPVSVIGTRLHTQF